MKKSKIAVVLVLCAAVTLGLASCGTPYSDVDFSKYIEVGKYKELTVQEQEVTVSDEEVDAEIQNRLAQKAKTEEVKKGTVADGDTVVITYEGKIDGKAFDGGSAQGYSLKIGSGQFIDGFESGLVGATIGETVVLDLKFPKDYSESSIAGKDVKFSVSIDSVQKTVIPKLNEKFVTKNSDAKSVKEYKKLVKKDLLDLKEEAEKTRQKQELWKQVVMSSEVKKNKDDKEQYPKEQLSKIVDETIQTYKDYAEQLSLTFDEFLKQQMNMDNKTFNKQVNEYAKVVVKEEEVLYYIVDKEGIEISHKEYKEYIEKTLEKFGYDESSFKEVNGKSYEETIGKDNIKRQIYMEKVLDFILSEATVTPAGEKAPVTEKSDTK